jgi:hypothetical protein
MTEEFTLEQLRRERCTMHDDELLFRPAAEGVNCLRHELPCRAAFSLDEDGGTRGSDLFDRVEHFVYHAGVSDQTLEAVTLLHLLFQLTTSFSVARLRAPVDQDFEFVDVIGFVTKSYAPRFHRLDRRRPRSRSSHHDNDRRMRHCEHLVDQLHSVFATEAQIGEDEVKCSPSTTPSAPAISAAT